MNPDAQSLQKEVAALRSELTRKDQHIKLLEQKIDALARKLFGKSSEQLDDNQLQLLLGELSAKKPEGGGHENPEGEPPQKVKTKKTKRTSRQATLPDDLPTEEVILIPEEVQQEPELYREIDEEVTEKLDYAPAQFKRIITRRKKFVKKLASLDDPEARQFWIAPLPPSLKERSLLTPRLAAQIATDRYCEHQPYYRQEQHFLRRHNVHLPRNTMSQWMSDLAQDYLVGIYHAMHTAMLGETYLQADETPIDYLKPGNGSVKRGYLWTLSRPDLNALDGRGDIFYQWHTGRSARCLEDLLQNTTQRFTGILQCDGYSAYIAHQKSAQNIELIGCWAHVRRKFYEARNDKPKISLWIIRQIQNLYAIESKLRKKRASPAERERVRTVESLPIYHRLGKALKILTLKRKILPQSALGRAITYALGQGGKLERIFQDGRVEIDNNLIENGIRPTKLGAKNWLFIGSESAGQTSAIWYTLIESCRRRRIDPWRYLVWIFEELPKEKVKKDTFASYTPEAYSKRQVELERAS